MKQIKLYKITIKQTERHATTYYELEFRSFDGHYKVGDFYLLDKKKLIVKIDEKIVEVSE